MSVNTDAFWMPFTANRQFKAEPRLLVAAKGMNYTTEDGRTLLDGTAGLWCVNAGHGREAISEAVHKQISTLDYGPTFQMGHPAPFELAERLVQYTPDGLNKVFFTNSGSESVDTALKIALAYHRAKGDGQRTRLIGREKGYHGVGFGGISVGGLVNNKRGYTYSGHPVAAAAGLATLDIYEAEGLFQRALELEVRFQDALHSLNDLDVVKDIRNIGLVGGIELHPRDGAVGARGYDVFHHCYWQGNVLTRCTADTLALSPPLIISEDQIDQIISAIRTAIQSVG